MRACVATVLEIPYEETPRVSGLGTTDDYEVEWQTWMVERGLGLVVHSYLPIFRQRWIAGLDGDISGLRRDLRGHAVVMEHDQLWHDPAPARLRRRSVDLSEIRAAQSILPIGEDPWGGREPGGVPTITRPFDSALGVRLHLGRGEIAEARQMAQRIGREDLLNG